MLSLAVICPRVSSKQLVYKGYHFAVHSSFWTVYVKQLTTYYEKFILPVCVSTLSPRMKGRKVVNKKGWWE